MSSIEEYLPLPQVMDAGLARTYGQLVTPRNTLLLQNFKSGQPIEVEIVSSDSSNGEKRPLYELKGALVNPYIGSILIQEAAEVPEYAGHRIALGIAGYLLNPDTNPKGTKRLSTMVNYNISFGCVSSTGEAVYCSPEDSKKFWEGGDWQNMTYGAFGGAYGRVTIGGVSLFDTL